jgi:hypothetical protein
MHNTGKSLYTYTHNVGEKLTEQTNWTSDMIRPVYAPVSLFRAHQWSEILP